MDFLPSIHGFSAFVLLLVGLGFVIFVHELGHFMVAKWVGVRVHQFAVGFGHAALAYRRGMGVRVGTTEPEYRARLDRGEDPARYSETEYRLNWIPLGGYVKMLGQDDLDPNAVSTDPASFNNKPIWARMCVISAGVIMNLIFAVIFFLVAFMHGVAFPPAEVGDVAPRSPAATAVSLDDPALVGLAPGDRFVSIDGKRPSDFADVRVASLLAARGRSLDITVDRPALDDPDRADRLRFRIEPRWDDEQALLMLGVMQPLSLDLPGGRAFERMPGADDVRGMIEGFGLEPGMRLVAVDGEPIETHWQFRRLLDASRGGAMQLTFRHPDTDETRTVTIQPDAPEWMDDGTSQHMLGLAPPTQVRDVVAGSAADGVLREGDIFAAVGAVAWPTTTELADAVWASVDADTGRPGVLEVTVLREGRLVDTRLTPRLTGGTPMLGIRHAPPTDRAVFARVRDDSPFADAGIAPGSLILRVAGEPIGDVRDLVRALQAHGPGEVSVVHRPVVGREEQTASVALTADHVAALAALGWRVDLPPFQTLRVVQRADTPIGALVLGYEKTVLWMQRTYMSLLRLVQGSVSPQHLSGPVGIIHIGTEMGQQGWAYLVFFLGLISVALAVFNFLPLPIVDGGLFVMLIIEKLRGKPLPAQVQSAITLAGLALLLSIFVMVTWFDIQRLIGG